MHETRAGRHGVKPVFRFGVEHAWLKFGVALPTYAEQGVAGHGAIEDGAVFESLRSVADLLASNQWQYVVMAALGRPKMIGLVAGPT